MAPISNDAAELDALISICSWYRYRFYRNVIGARGTGCQKVEKKKKKR